MKKKIVAFTLAMVLAFASVVSVQAQETKEWIDPAEAAKVLDYQIQGEYVGDFIEDGEKTTDTKLFCAFECEKLQLLIAIETSSSAGRGVAFGRSSMECGVQCASRDLQIQDSSK